MKDITIIGAGLGGLTAGALLAKDGHKVTILEQHNIVGGCATTFKRKGGFICEVGLHEMEGVYTNPQIKDIFDKLGVYDNIEFVKPDEFFSVVTKNGLFVMPDDVTKAEKALIDRFPSQEKSILKYFQLIRDIYQELGLLQRASWYHYMLFPFMFKTLLLYKNKTVTEVLNNIINNEELKLILNTNVQYYNDTPDTLSFLLHGVAQYSYYLGGGYFIKGGSQKLSDYLAKLIRDNGGKIVTKADVIKCTTNSVTYMYKKEQQTIYSDVVVSNLSPKQTYDLYDKPYNESKEMGSSLLTIYLGFSKNIKDIYGNKPYSNFIYDDINSVSEYNDMLKKDIAERGFVFVDYSQVDSELTVDRDKSFAAICMNDYYEEWIDLDADEYEKKKQNLIDSMIKRLEKYYPDISDIVEYAEVGTAKTVERYIKTPNGTAYGYKPTPKQFFRIPKVKSDKVKNLYFVGQWVIAGGFSPTITSGKICYEKILKFRTQTTNNNS